MLTKDKIDSNNGIYEVNFDTFSKNFKFSGQTLEKWCKDFYFEIPDNVDFKDIVELSAKVDDLLSTAHNNYVVAYGIYEMSKRSLEKKKSAKYTELSNDGTGRRTAAALEHEINNIVEDELDRVTVAEYICEFWKEQIKSLTGRKDALEQIFWALKNQKGLET